jgi:hypothetical protein
MVDEGFICDNASMRASVNISCILNTNTNTFGNGIKFLVHFAKLEI